MLATLEALKRYVGMNQIYRVEDDCLEACLGFASGRIEKYCGRDFALLETVDYCDGAGTQELVLSRRPVTELYTVEVDPDHLLGIGTGLPHSEIVLHAESGIIERVGKVFPRGTYNVKVSYAAGYSVIPEDLALACVKLAAQLYLVSDFSAETEALVAPYKNRR